MIEGFTVMWRTRCFFASIDLLWLFIGNFNNFILEICPLVIGAARTHPVTSRTRSLSSPALMVLGGRPPGRVGHCQRTFSLKDTNYFSQKCSKPAIIPIFKYNSCRCVTDLNSSVCPKFSQRFKLSAEVTIFHLWREVRVLARVVLRPNESQEQLLRRFRKQVVKDGTLSTLRKKRWFISKSELRRIEKKKAIRRSRRPSYR